MGGDFVSVGDETLNELQAVGIGGVLDAATDGVANGLAKKVHELKN